MGQSGRNCMHVLDFVAMVTVIQHAAQRRKGNHGISAFKKLCFCSWLASHLHGGHTKHENEIRAVAKSNRTG